MVRGNVRGEVAPLRRGKRDANLARARRDRGRGSAEFGHGDPLGLPFPRRLDVGELLSTRNGTGDGRGPIPGAAACDSTQPAPISLPADDAPHNDQFLEWWWWNGHLETDDGRRFAFIVYFMSKPLAGIQMADTTLLDLEKNAFHVRRETLILGAPKATTDGFSLHGPGVSAEGGDGHDVLHAELDGWVLDAVMTETKPPSSPLAGGYMTYYCNGSYFYKRLRMAIEGTLVKDGASVRVRGTGDFDHQWGFMPALAPASWTYVSLALEDGRDIFLASMVFPPHRDDFQLLLGSISDADGNVTLLHRDDFAITPTAHWRRDASCAYPVEFDVEVKGARFSVKPAIREAELRASSPLDYVLWPENPVYWDGETIIDGDSKGRGWVDMAKHCPL